jgi:hypothetical protein
MVSPFPDGEHRSGYSAVCLLISFRRLGKSLSGLTQRRSSVRPPTGPALTPSPFPAKDDVIMIVQALYSFVGTRTKRHREAT